MARISGVDLPREKRVEIGLTYIYGIGRTSADQILKAADVNPDTRVRDLTDDEVRRLSDIINADYTVEGDLRREIAMKLDATEESVIEKDYLFVDRRQRQTLEHVKVLRKLLQTRRNK